jgi:pimeloyl-ACP methyl ester carboxylesterase
MTMGGLLGSLLLVVFAGCLLIAWLLIMRPLTVWAWGTRRALVRAGLKQVHVPTSVGPQTAFVGGAGPVLVLLHGAGDQAGTWSRVAPSLLKRYTLVIPDLAGHGDSAPSTGPIQASDVFVALETLLPGLSEGRRVTLVGNSLGAWMAMLLAHRHPDWVAKVVAVNGGALRGTSAEVRMLPATRQEARETWAQLRDPGSPAVPDRILDDIVRRARTGPLARFLATAASLEAWTLSEDQLRTLRVPVRLIWGVSDGLMPLDYARRLMALLPDAELIPLERCGHIPQQEAPGRFQAGLEQALHGGHP